MNLNKEEEKVKKYLVKHRNQFEEMLLTEARNVKDKIEEVRQIGNINLLENAHKLVLFVVEKRKQDMIAFARQEGVAWAKHSLTLSFKLEWIQAIRRTLWRFLFDYDQMGETAIELEEFYELEKGINDQIDQFLNSFFLSYSNYKDDLIESQRQLVENLSVPIIPLSSSICVLPLIGAIDSFRSKTIEEKVLIEIGKLRINTLIMDLSGLAVMEASEIYDLLKIIDGISMMGCNPVITGLRPEFVRTIIQLGLSFEGRAEIKGTLQQALKDKLLNN